MVSIIHIAFPVTFPVTFPVRFPIRARSTFFF